jgi:hypothetical protein
MITIESIVYQRPTTLLQQYEFSLTYLEDDQTQVLPATVTVSYSEGVTTIVDISIEGELPTGFADAWNPEWAIKQIHFELGEELSRITKEN